MAPKRNASSSPRAAKKAKFVDPDVSAVTAVLSDPGRMPEDVPKRVLDMLAGGFPHAIATGPAERHAVQDSFIGCVKDVLSGGLALQESKHNEAVAAVAQQETACKELQDKLEAAEKKKSAAIAEHEAQSQKLCDCQGAVKTEEKASKAAEAELKAQGKERAKLEKQRERYVAIKEQGLEPLLAGDIKPMNKFKKDMESIGCESSLLASAPAVLAKPNEERKGFDVMVIDSIRAIIDGHVSRVDGELAAFDEAGKAVTEKAEQFRASLERLRAARDAQDQITGEACAAQHQAEGEHREAENAVEESNVSLAGKRSTVDCTAEVAKSVVEVLSLVEKLAAGKVEEPVVPVEPVEPEAPDAPMS